MLTSPGFRSAAKFMVYLTPLGCCQIPDRSGLPSAAFGAGAVRFGLPSAVRGIPGDGIFSHWAETGTVMRRKIVRKSTSGLYPIALHYESFARAVCFPMPKLN